MSKHTPGPFRVVVDAHGIKGKYQIVGPDEEDIAVIRLGIKKGSLEVAAANAQLFAAAPELLNVAHVALDLVDGFIGGLRKASPSDALESGKTFNEFRSLISKAIAKAEGKS